MGSVIEGGHMYISDNSSNNSIGNAGVFGTRGPITFTESGTFNIKEYGLEIGDRVNVICVGGGGGGGSSAYGAKGYDAGMNGGYGSGGDGRTGSTSSTYNANPGGGGGSGYVNQGTITLQEELINITIGAGGAGGAKATGSGNAGKDGDTTLFGSYLSAAGGKGGGGGAKYSTGATISGNGSGGAGGQYGTKSDTFTEAGKGGAGVIVSGQFAVSVTTGASVQGAGACFIWY